jgi:hypothetical protein
MRRGRYPHASSRPSRPCRGRAYRWLQIILRDVRACASDCRCNACDRLFAKRSGLVARIRMVRAVCEQIRPACRLDAADAPTVRDRRHRDRHSAPGGRCVRLLGPVPMISNPSSTCSRCRQCDQPRKKPFDQHSIQVDLFVQKRLLEQLEHAEHRDGITPTSDPVDGSKRGDVARFVVPAPRLPNSVPLSPTGYGVRSMGRLDGARQNVSNVSL